MLDARIAVIVVKKTRRISRPGRTHGGAGDGGQQTCEEHYGSQQSDHLFSIAKELESKESLMLLTRPNRSVEARRYPAITAELQSRKVPLAASDLRVDFPSLFQLTPAEAARPNLGDLKSLESTLTERVGQIVN
jgi:hypothetical protein